MDIFSRFSFKWRGGNKMTYRENRNNPEDSRRVYDQVDSVKRKLDGVVDSMIPPDKGCEVLDGELTHESRDENDSETFPDSADAYILLKWGVIIKCHEG